MCQKVRLFIPVAAAAVLLSLPCTHVSANNNHGATTAQTVAPSEENGTTAKTTTAKPKTKPVAAKTRDKSVLDADALDSPLSYFKEAFTPEEDNNGHDGSPTLTNTVKALVATLLSTIM
ncbi:hypothetical protein H8S95_16610 [Pontibacter sp. KCTC 32443]|uniref:hypothetical protein n=1 Tax=Pontibacter TaxID=323449 RepID=UPI00164E1A23|nr:MULTISPECIES: hypothetical protein [Pontibacter]MBC5775702.1 hypothetical protein [Pontibacter sp. KCTC 32443]